MFGFRLVCIRRLFLCGLRILLLRTDPDKTWCMLFYNSRDSVILPYSVPLMIQADMGRVQTVFVQHRKTKFDLIFMLMTLFRESMFPNSVKIYVIRRVPLPTVPTPI